VSNRFSLEGKTAIVTGGSRGIGLAVAAAFIEAGARVVITARGEDALNQAAAALGANAIAKRCDHADPADAARCVEEAWRLAPIDILVNNAGVSPYYKRHEHVTVDDFELVMGVNVRGAYFTATAVAARMIEAGRPGVIVNMSSMGGSVPLDRLGVYCASKAAMDSLTRTMALEWAERGIRVNGIAPGWVDTDFTSGLFSSRHGERLLADVPQGRLATSDDIAGAALFLASDASAFATGTTIAVDGGRALR
jgi:NAD(P)-dependent dehydrogenase (short-subunit alcohol dehydrogenase family)